MTERDDSRKVNHNGKLMDVAMALNQVVIAKSNMQKVDPEHIIRCAEIMADLSDSELAVLVNQQKLK
ncbi:hypothetical protein A2165_00175 [Candidatus Curtissbacteria bacterium RBG_13_40_7]|uniref:Uncharacterized protein n=1 Tax=Candidatus Curtissbacteria bacterium RBG_13_40_7 TaxID=1797706 RepID=A0A1F5FY58_9BACT|nr:MAG: hypothetical protein A2165_00175 [Candidatus Curtissbacteria bacterium RBG_13_40_7]